MKRFILVLLGGLLLNSLAFAQLGVRTQRGRATQELQAEGYSAAHNNIPLDSIAKITNTTTGEEIEVTITGRIASSRSRVIDLSLAAWEALKLTPDTIVMVVYNPPPPVRNNPTRRPQPAQQTAPEPEPVLEIAAELEPEPEITAEPEYRPEPEPAPRIAAEPEYEPEPVIPLAIAEPENVNAYDEWAGYEEYAEYADAAEHYDEYTGYEDGTKYYDEHSRYEDDTVYIAQTGPSIASQLMYHLLILDRTHSAPGSGIGDLRDVSMVYQFKHGKNGYLIALYTSAAGPVFPAIPEKSRVLVGLTTAREVTLKEYVNSSAFKRFVTNKKVLAEIQAALEKPAAELRIAELRIKVIPSLPNPNSGKIYRLQVGAFSLPKSAAETERQLRDAGFTAARETHGSLYRVMAVGIRAADVHAALRRLESAGFKEVWIRE